MKTNWIRTLTLSAAVLTMGSAAWAQSRLAAEIPFSFRLNGTELPAGKYSIERASSSVRNVMQLNNGHQVKMALGSTTYGSEMAPARLVFSCREGSGCTLIQVWGNHGEGVQFPRPKMTSAEKERLAVVFLQKSQAD